MVKGLVMGEQGEWTDRVMRCDPLGKKWKMMSWGDGGMSEW
jgi:hypothetical protein